MPFLAAQSFNSLSSGKGQTWGLSGRFPKGRESKSLRAETRWTLAGEVAEEIERGTPSKYLRCSPDSLGQSLLPSPPQEQTQGQTHRLFPGH